MKQIIPFFALFLLYNNNSYAQFQAPTMRAGKERDAVLDVYDYQPTIVKTGWNLIFEDNFDGTKLDTNKWHISGIPTDADYPNASPNEGAFANPENVRVEGGNCYIRLNNKPYWGRPYSAGEIKTGRERSINTKNNQPCSPQNPCDWRGDDHYGFGENTYIEIRAKMPVGKGIGSAAWLWLPWQTRKELDIWETYGNFAPNRFRNTYIYQEKPDSEESFSIKDFVLKDGRSIEQNYSVFGIYRDSLGFKIYINGVLMRDLKFSDTPPCSIDRWLYSKCPLPYTHNSKIMELRLSTVASMNADNTSKNCASHSKARSNFLECGGDFDKELIVDYVRVYQKQGSTAINARQAKPSLKKSDPYDFATIEFEWYPDVAYKWELPKQLKSANWNERWRMAVALSEPNTPEGSYPVSLTATFESGYVEKKTLQVLVTK